MMHTTHTTQSDCEQVEPLLFAMLEGEVTPEERAVIQRHLAHCPACEALLADERQLNDCLGVTQEFLSAKTHNAAALSVASPAAESPGATASPQTTRAARHRLGTLFRIPTMAGLALSLMLLVTAAIQWNLPTSQAAFGSVQAGTIIPTTAPQHRTLQASNHIEVATGSKQAIDLNGVGQIHVLGPAVFELDQVDRDWKLTLLTGEINLAIQAATRQMQVATKVGVQQLAVGRYAVDSQSGAVDVARQAQDSGESPERMLNSALGVFHERIADAERLASAMLKSAEILRRAAEHPAATAEQRGTALFYGAAAYANAKKYEAALELMLAWREEHPDEFVDTAEFIVGEALWHTEKTDEAKEVWHKLLKESPDSPYRGSIERLLQSGRQPQGNSLLQAEIQLQGQQSNSLLKAEIQLQGINGNSQEPESALQQAGKMIETSLPADKPEGAYVVVAVGLDASNAEHQALQKVAEEITAFHEGELIAFDGQDFETLQAELKRRQALYVAFVVPPETLDVNLHRHFLLMSMGMDDDAFADFVFGYFTARDGAALESFWQRTVALYKNGLPAKRWLDTSVIGSASNSRVFPNAAPNLWSALAGFQGEKIWFRNVEADANVLDFVKENLRRMEDASVISMSGNGDPQGVWLFSDQRNIDHSKHWDFDPAKVGQDPQGELARIKAASFRELNLKHSPLIMSGTCHCGATHRVYVEPDIVSTFGTSDNIELYEMPADESMCLAMIDAGAGALLVPIASNHGNSASCESYFGVVNGATLGETVKSTYDDICFQADGPPKLQFAVAGDPFKYTEEHIMRGGGANRILVGDPALTLFSPTEEAGDSVQTKRIADKHLQVTVARRDGYHPRDWNIFGEWGKMESRVDARLRLPADVHLSLSDTPQVSVEVRLEDGTAVEHRTSAKVEEFAGDVYLYLQASAPGSELFYKGRTATFDVKW